MIERKDYQDYVKHNVPKSPMWRTLIASFIVGGLICVIGEGIGDVIKLIFPSLSEKDVATWASVVLIFLGSFFTAVGLYDKLGHFAGAGSIVPITGFANSVISPAIEFNREGVFYGICAKMFVIAGPIIVFGMTASFLVGIVGYFITLGG